MVTYTLIHVCHDSCKPRKFDIELFDTKLKALNRMYEYAWDKHYCEHLSRCDEADEKAHVMAHIIKHHQFQLRSHAYYTYAWIIEHDNMRHIQFFIDEHEITDDLAPDNLEELRMAR